MVKGIKKPKAGMLVILNEVKDLVAGMRIDGWRRDPSLRSG
jgi:hypothetical protein